MNSVIFYEDEFNQGYVRVSGERARSVSEKIGDRKLLPIGILGAHRAKARVIVCSSDCVELEVTEIMPALPRLPVHCIVGLSRPQTIKKILQASGLFGIESLTFVASENGEKSYLQSHSLHPDAIQQELILAIEQSCDSLLPDVHVKRSFRELSLGDVDAQNILLDVRGDALQKINFMQTEKVMLSIGPEAGWSDIEKEFFVSNNFLSVSFGSRVLRVETAMSAALGYYLGSGMHKF